MKIETMARGLGWFGVGLGVIELLGGSRLSRALGLERRSPLLRLFGLREIATSLPLIGRKRRAPFLWARVLGDGLDIAMLADAIRQPGRRRKAAAVALANVAAVTALDLLCAERA